MFDKGKKFLDKKNLEHSPKFSKFSKNQKRMLIKNEEQKPDKLEETFIGVVLSSYGRFYYVLQLETRAEIDIDKSKSSKEDEIVFCTECGALFSNNMGFDVITTGDIVRFRKSDKRNIEGLFTGSISQIEERGSFIARKAIGNDNDQIIASNIDKLCIVMSAAEPFYNTRFVDRLLISAEDGGVEPLICINKIDLATGTELMQLIEDDFQIYRNLGISVFFVSAILPDSLVSFREFIKGTATLLSGPSGVGKSTILNSLLGKEKQVIKEVSQKTGKGMHTTTFARMFKNPESGYIIDTPGIREFGLWNITPENLANFFHDFDEFSSKCKYNPCTHTHEPDCGVKSALEHGLVTAERYQSYLNILDSL